MTDEKVEGRIVGVPEQTYEWVVLQKAKIKGLERAVRNAEETSRKYVTQWHEGAAVRNALMQIIQKARLHRCSFVDPLVEIAQAALDDHARKTKHREAL